MPIISFRKSVRICTGWLSGARQADSPCVSTGEMPLNFEEATTIFQERKIDFDHYEGKDFEIAKEYADRIKAQGALCYFEFFP